MSPGAGAFEGAGSGEHGAIGEMSSDDLHSDWQPVLGEAGGDAGCGLAGQVADEGEGEPLRVTHHLAFDDLRALHEQREGGHRERRCDQEIVGRHQPPHLVADHLADRLGIGEFGSGPFAIDEIEEMRRDLVLTALAELAHAGEVGVAGHQRPEVGQWVFPARIDLLDCAAEVALENLHRLRDNATHFGIDGRVAPVLAIGDLQSFDGF